MKKNIVITVLLVIIFALLFSANGGRAPDGKSQELCFSIYNQCALQCMLDAMPDEHKKNE